MKVYIATNKDNKDALMHYGVKGMRWGKRGDGRFKLPWEKDPTAGYKPESSRSVKKEAAKTVGKHGNHGIRGSLNWKSHHKPSEYAHIPYYTRTENGHTLTLYERNDYRVKRRKKNNQRRVDERKQEQRRSSRR